jgi:indolepyruvate ferredoxin oxidoreductase alpha subunit
VDPLDHRTCIDTITEAIGQQGVRAIIFRSPCIALKKKEKECRVDADKCVGCLRCINEIGCPALAPANDSVVIDPALCTGCTLCAQVCPTGSIR